MGAVIGPRFIVRGFEPATVRLAPRADRLAYWEAVSSFVIEAKEDELKKGLDRHGRPMKPLARSTIENRHSEMGPADPLAPALQPAHGLSRTRSLFTSQPTSAADGVTCWWLYDSKTGASWGEILRIHRQGGKRLPKRDVIGLSPQSLAIVAARASTWWTRYRRDKATPAPTPQREELPTPAPKFLVDRVAPYQPKNPARATPKNSQRMSQLQINGHTYTLQSPGTAAKVRRAIAGGTYIGPMRREERRRLQEQYEAAGAFVPDGRKRKP